MSVKAKNITTTEDGLPIFNKSATPSTSKNTTEDGLPILKKKEDGGTASKVSPSAVGVQTPITPQPSTSVSVTKPTGPKDWSSIENAFKGTSERNKEYEDAKNFSFDKNDITEGISLPNMKFASEYQKEAKTNLDKSIKQKNDLIAAHQQELYAPIKELIESGKYKDYFDGFGNFKTPEAISYFDNITKANKAGNYTRDMMVSLFKQAGQYELEQPERKKLREEEYKKSGIDINKYGINLLDKLTSKQKNNVDLLEKETKARAANLMEQLKPKSVEIGQQYMEQVNQLKAQYQQQQISETDANNKLKELNNQYHSQISALDKEYQNGVRQLNINAQNKYANINSEIQNVEKSVTDEMIWQSIPEADRKKIESINNNVESEIQRRNNVLRQGLDIVSDAGQAPLTGLFQKSIKSGWYSGLASMGNYLSSKGYNNGFTRYLQGKDYEAAVNAPAEYTYKDNFLKRTITGTGTSLGASAPIMLPSIGIVAGTSGLGLPEVVGTIASGLTSYYGEKAQNTGQVYQEIMDKTGDPSKAIEGARRYEDKQTVMMPLYFIEAAGLQNLLKGGIKKAVIGTAQELTQELPTEYWQNYTQAQEAEGYKGSFGSYIKEHPETTLDVIASTLGQSGMVSMAGKVFNQISSLVPQSKAQFYADIIGKHGIDFAMENLQHQFNTGVIDENQFQAEQAKLMLAAKKMKDFEGLGLKGEDAKAYFTLTENANRLKKAIGETDDEGLRIGYEAQLKQNQQQLDELVKGKGAYAIFTLPGGGDQTKIVPLANLETLDKDGKLNMLIHLSDKVEVKGDENLNKEYKERKRQLGNPDAPEGFYSQSREEIATEQNKIANLEKSHSILEQSLKNGQIKGTQADVAQMVLNQAKDNPQIVHDFFKEVADQALNKVAGEVGDPSAAAEQTYGKDIVNRAKELFPVKPTLESIQQQATESYKVVEPILQRINNADYINEKELDNATNHLYDVLDQVEKSDMTDEQKQSSANLIEPLIQKMEGYEFRTKTQTSTITEAKTASIPTKTKTAVRPALEQSTGSKITITTPDGSTATGTLNIRSGQYTVDIQGGQQRVIGEKAITDRDLTLPTEQEMENPIKFDKNGNVESITVKDRNGNLIEIKNPEKALDMAIQLRADAIGEVPAQLFDNTYEEIQKEISEEKLIEPSKSQENAQEIRKDQGISAKAGEAVTGGKTDSGSNIQQTKETGTETGDKGKQIGTVEDFEKELKKALTLEDSGALPRLGEINKEKNVRPQNEDVTQYSDPKNILQKAKEFYKNANPLINKVISFLEPIINGNPNIKIDTNFKWDTNQYEGQKITNQALGYSFPSGNLLLNFDKIGDYDTLYRTALHEMVHAATRNEINTNKAFNDELKTILSDVRKAMGLPEGDSVVDALVRNNIISQDYENRYGAANEHELLAEVFSNDKFHEYLKGLEYKGDNLLHRIFVAIAKLFSEKYKQLGEAKEKISANNIADYLTDLTSSVVKGIGGEEEGTALPSLKGDESNQQIVDDKIKGVIGRATSLSDSELFDSIKKVTGLENNRINKLINEVRGKDISQQKQKTNETKTEKAKTQEAEGLRNEVTSQTGVGKEGVSDSETGTPSKPPTSPEPKKVGTPKEEWTAINKEKLQQVQAVKDMFEANAEKKKWVGVIQSALNNLQQMYPDKSLYDAAKSRVQYFASLFDNKIAFNPTTEDLAVAEYFKSETEKAINDISGWDSQDEADRIFSVSQFKSLNEDLVNVAKAINPSEAGRAFGFRQSEMRLDPEYGLKIRRMEMLDAKGGEKLTDEEKDWTANQWEKEKDLMKQEQNLKEKRMTEEFDKRMAELKKEYDEKLKQAKKTPTKKEKESEKREDYLKNKGKEWADKIRKGKLGGTYTTIPLLPQLINTAIEGIAKLVEAGYTIADAIDKHIKDNNLKQSEGDAIRNHFTRFVDQQIKQLESLDKIKELAKNNQVTSITSDMVAKNLVKDYVESHIGEVAPENLLDHVASKLEEVLPNLTKYKLTEAYLKTGEFKIPSRQQLQTQYEQDKSKLQRIAKLEKDINDLKSKKDIYNRSGNKESERQVDKDITAKEKELKKSLQDVGLKISGEDKFSKASNQTRAQSHNDRINSLSNKIDDLITNGNLTPEQKSALTKLNGQLDAAKIKLDENSKLSQKAVMDNADNMLKRIYSDFDKSLGIKDMVPVSAIRKGLRQAVDKFNTEKEDSEQQLKLQRTKDNLERNNAELQRKINAGEFNDESTTILKKSDAQLVKLQIENNKLKSETRQKIKEVKDKNKTKVKRYAKAARGLYVAGLIWKFGTLAKVGIAAATKPTLNAVTKATGGQLLKAISPTLYERAKAGGESSSVKTIKEIYKAQFRGIGEQKMNEIKDRLYNQYNTDRDAYVAQEKLADEIKQNHGDNSKEYKAEAKKLESLKSNMNTSLLNSTGAFIYDFIGSNSYRDALDALIYRTNKIERQFGHVDQEKWEKGFPEKANYLLGFIGRSHAALKSFSARSEFAAGFIARAEYALNNGVDITDPDKILEIAHESYLDWERGKYTQSNFATDLFNHISNSIEKFSEGTKWEKYSKAVGAALKWDTPITRVPVNIIHEAVAEYTFGAFRSAWLGAKEYFKARGQVINEQEILPNEKEFKEAVRNQLSKMDEKQAATIARCFRKGGFGLGMYAFAAITGLIAFGGFHHKGEKKKKDEELEEGELNPGELMIGNKKLGETLSKGIEHLPFMYPILFGQNWAKAKKENIENGKGTFESEMDGALANLQAIEENVPFTKYVSPSKTIPTVTKATVKALEYPAGLISNWVEGADVDAEGKLITRVPLDFNDHIKLLSGDRKDVLTEENYKQALSILRKYKKAISDAHKIHESAEDIESLKQERDEEIKQIYELNKNQ